MEQPQGSLIYSTKVDLTGTHASEKDVAASELINDENRRVLAISIRGGSALKRHRAAEPITVLCTAGEGTFRAGAELEEAIEIGPGTLLTLDPEIDHEVEAATDVRIIVTRFK